MLTEEYIERIFSNFYCPECGEKFDENSVKIVREGEDGLVVLQFGCKQCSKSFGVAFLGLSGEDLKNCSHKKAKPIDYDDVLNAHLYIENFEENWREFIQTRKIKE